MVTLVGARRMRLTGPGFTVSDAVTDLALRLAVTVWGPACVMVHVAEPVPPQVPSGVIAKLVPLASAATLPNWSTAKTRKPWYWPALITELAGEIVRWSTGPALTVR